MVPVMLTFYDTDRKTVKERSEAPRGFGDLGRMAIYNSGSCGALELFSGFGEQAHSFWDLGSPAKSEKISP